jgi:hypothetical protein
MNSLAIPGDDAQDLVILAITRRHARAADRRLNTAMGLSPPW